MDDHGARLSTPLFDCVHDGDIRNTLLAERKRTGHARRTSPDDENSCACWERHVDEWG